MRAEEAARRDTRLLLALILAATLVRIGFAWSLGLGIDESYMVAAGRTLTLGYFDHPPASWWMQWAAAHLFATEAPLAVRAPFIAAFALSTWLMFRLGVAVSGTRAGLWAAVAFSLSPVFGVTTGTWVLPDGPLDCALLGAALCLVHALPARGGTARAWWAGAGLCAGIALFSKYTAVLTIGGAFLYLLAGRTHRRWLARPEPYVAGVLALAVFSPVIAWNAAHHWASFAFQGDRAAGLRFRPGQPFAVLAGEALFVLPWIWLPMMVAAFAALTPSWPGLARAPTSSLEGRLEQDGFGSNRVVIARSEATKQSPARRRLLRFARNDAKTHPALDVGGRAKPGHDDSGWRPRLLCALAAPPIVLFALVALWSSGRVLYHWAAPGYLMLFPLLGAWLADRPRLAARGAAVTAAFVLLALAVVCTQIRLDWLHPALVATGARDPDIQGIDWTSVRQNLDARGLLAPGTVVGVPNWRDAGKIAYALGPAVTVTVLNSDARQFGFVAPAASFVGHDMLILAPEHPARAAARLAPAFAGIESLAPAPIRHAGRTVANVAVFRTGRLLAWPAPQPQASANTSPVPVGNGSSAQLSPPSRVPNTSPVFAAK